MKVSKELSQADVLKDELTAIRGVTVDATDNTIYRSLNEQHLAALCLSGGGIRSASFALGVVQALAAHPCPTSLANKKGRPSLLSAFDYLSTVSGGGYTGSCLSTWIKRRGFSEVQHDLASPPSETSLQPASVKTASPDVLGWLRAYTNYLTPKLGVMSADTWAAVALSVRNILLNWLVLIPIFFMGVLLVDLLAFGAVWVGQTSPYFSFSGWKIGIPIVAAILLVFAFAGIGRFRPTLGSSRATQADVFSFIVVPMLLGSMLLCGISALPNVVRFVNDSPSCRDNQVGSCVGELSFWGMLAGVLLCTLARFLALPAKPNSRDMLGCAVAGAAFGALMGIGLYLQTMTSASNIILVTVGVPWCLACYLISDMIFVGVTSYLPNSDADREWLARLAGTLVSIAIVWLGLTALVLIGGQVAQGLLSNAKQFIAAMGLSGIFTAALGASKLTPASGEAKGGIKISANLVLAVVAPVFAASLIVLLSVIANHLFFDSDLSDSNFWSTRASFTDDVPAARDVGVTLLAFVCTAIVGLFASGLININRFSLHALYRNRIIRAFLGASRTDRDATVNPFSGFDVADNLPLHTLWKSDNGSEWKNGEGNQWRPFHVVNIALNLVGGKKLAWQERKAESFVATPLAAGSSELGFRNSADYGDPDGISVGTSVAISGAAASPNMGYHSSPALSFLLTLFNVRLGWWLGNPGLRGNTTFWREGPRFAAHPLVSEMLGQTDETHPYVYLSDGGHFENLGLYEMVRRRCTLIVVSDAGCDPNFQFEDLGNAIRKISIDLGIAIDFDDLDVLRNRCDAKKLYESEEKVQLSSVVVGKIHYSRNNSGCEDGVLVYIKPTFYTQSIRNVGVLNYGTMHPEFPHEGTGNQWFTEGQFESYRALGFELMDEYLRKSEPSSPLK